MFFDDGAKFLALVSREQDSDGYIHIAEFTVEVRMATVSLHWSVIVVS